VLVKDIEGTDYADSLTVAGSLLFFRANDGTHGYELWKSDGSASGTVMVKDINPDLVGDPGSYPSFLTALGTTLYFSAYEPANGTELWKSNGTASGTVLVKDINAADEDGNPEALFAMGPTLYFNATDGINGLELWGVTPDNTPPTGTILINNNRSATSNTQVTLTLSWNDGAGSGVVRMRFSDDGATWTPWEPLAATRTHTLPAGDAHKTVRAQYRDASGNISAAYTDYIRLDTAPPTGTIVINGGAVSTTNPLVTLSLTWADGAGAGVSRMRFSDDGATWTPWEPPLATVQHLLPLPPGGHQTVRVQYRDGADNVSIRYNDYIRLDAK
jgi:ELWxxDGT repeat protein